MKLTHHIVIDREVRRADTDDCEPDVMMLFDRAMRRANEAYEQALEERIANRLLALRTASYPEANDLQGELIDLMEEAKAYYGGEEDEDE